MTTTMDADAIVAEFKAAKRKQAAVADLAKKNGCTYEEMRTFLKEHGVGESVQRLPKSPEPKKRRGATGSDTSVSEVEQRYQETVRKQLDDIRRLRDENATLSAKAADSERLVSELDAKLQEHRKMADDQMGELQRLKDMLDEMQRNDLMPCKSAAPEQLQSVPSDPEILRLRTAIVNMALAIYGG